MKFIFPLTALFLFASCKSEAPIPDEPKPDPEAQIQAIRVGHAKLLNQKLGLEKQLHKIIAASQVDPSGEMKALVEEKHQAIIDLQTIRTTHPSLQKLNEELSLWRSHHRSARKQNRDSERVSANKKISKITTQIHTLSKELPAMREAEDSIARCEKEISLLRRALAEKTPEGKTIINELNKIEKELSSIQ